MGLLYGYSEKLPHLVAFYNTLGILRTHSGLKPRVLSGATVSIMVRKQFSIINAQ